MSPNASGEAEGHERLGEIERRRRVPPRQLHQREPWLEVLRGVGDEEDLLERRQEPGLGQEEQHRQFVADVGQLDGLPAVTRRVRELGLTHHGGHVDDVARSGGERGVAGEVGLERFGPAGVQVHGVHQHEAGEVVEGLGGEQLRDAVVRALGDPCVDGDPSAVGIGLEVDQLDARSVLGGEHVEERLLDVHRLVEPRGVREGELDTGTVAGGEGRVERVRAGVQVGVGRRRGRPMPATRSTRSSSVSVAPSAPAVAIASAIAMLAGDSTTLSVGAAAASRR